MKVWITKYALTQGVEEIDSNQVKEFEMTDTGYLCFRRNGKYSYTTELYSQKEWHRTKEFAIQKAEEMRQKKIASLKKQIEKLERMRFE